MFAADVELIDFFLGAIGDKRLRMTRSGTVVLEPPQVRPNPLATEILESLQPFLKSAYLAATVAPGSVAQWPYVHRACGQWRLMTKQRSTSLCACGDKSKRELITIPWASTNHHGRPNHPHYQKATPLP